MHLQEQAHLSVWCARVLSIVSKLLSIAQVAHCVCTCCEIEDQEATQHSMVPHRYISSNLTLRAVLLTVEFCEDKSCAVTAAQ